MEEAKPKALNNAPGDSEEPYLIAEPEKSAVSLLELQPPKKDGSDAKETMKEEEAMECSSTAPLNPPDVPGLYNAASEANEKAPTPITLTPADEQLVPTSKEVIVQCSCAYNGDDGMMILCSVCKNWQHASCYRFFAEEDCPIMHICVQCAKSENKECTDGTLVGLTPVKLQTTCLWRRALVACRGSTRLTAPKFADRLGVEYNVAHGLMKRMQNEGFLRQAVKGKRLGKLITKEKVTTEALKKYFYPSEDAVERNTESTSQQNEKLESKEKESLDEEELQRMVNKAAEIDISGKYRAKSAKATSKVAEVVDQKSKLRSRKRVMSAIDNDLEFSVSNSQDPMDCQHNVNPAKKQKASAAAQAIYKMFMSGF
ncbi:uncharacterized protein LOC114539699 [Dendronephthya gigantea]|uniref:uncharacterized protein LOC114539699 n=1 Tax=Dendronephthya gigantea TaxID=151771 RepID=UPI00106C1838|nr:uncharacterized protein LOC114539699 [Dendronephthya gigantea]